MKVSDITDPRRYAPATTRNRGPILEVLARILPPHGLVLEVAAGTGEHAAFLAAALPGVDWQPTDPDPLALASIAGHCDAAGLANLCPPKLLDAADAAWPLDHAEAIVCINMIHIAPWAACQGLFEGAAHVLPANGLLYLYGPFRQDEVPLAPSNARFDADLRARNPGWGLRTLTEVAKLATRHGFRLEETVSMPANNLSLVFRTRKQPPELTTR